MRNLALGQETPADHGAHDTLLRGFGGGEVGARKCKQAVERASSDRTPTRPALRGGHRRDQLAAIASPVACAALPVHEPAGRQLLLHGSGDWAAAQNVSHMADVPDWAARWLEQQSRLADAVAAVAPLDRVSRTWLIRLLQAVGLLGLLSLGVLANSTFAWAVIAIPMTMIVVLALSGRERIPRASSTVQRRPGPFDVQAMGPSVVEPSFNSPIMVARRGQSPLPEPLLIRRSR